jgi:hypothetical protein
LVLIIRFRKTGEKGLLGPIEASTGWPSVMSPADVKSA